MQNKHLDFYEVYDVRAVRILVENLRDCYAALGVVHSLWQHVSKEFDDYIANPKENGYQSLHTAVIGPGRKMLERSEEHTSELQSRPHLVCRLLLEKKKKKNHITHI